MAELDAAYVAGLHLREALTLLPAGRDGTDEPVGVDEVLAQRREGIDEGDGSHHRRAATTTIRMSAPSATGMTRRR